MSFQQQKRRSLCHLPRLQQSSSTETSKLLQKYLARLRCVHMPDYIKQNKPPPTSPRKHPTLKRLPTKKFSPNDQTLILPAITLYLNSFAPTPTDKSSQRHRRLTNRVLSLIHTYPSIAHKLLHQDDPRKLITDPQILRTRLSDQHQPILTQLTQKIEEFNCEQESSQLFSMGSRIRSLKANLVDALDVIKRDMKRCTVEGEFKAILKIRDQNRVSESISKSFMDSAEKYGDFSKGLRKREEFFGKLNRVVDMVAMGG